MRADVNGFADCLLMTEKDPAGRDSSVQNDKCSAAGNVGRKQTNNRRQIDKHT